MELKQLFDLARSEREKEIKHKMTRQALREYLRYLLYYATILCFNCASHFVCISAHQTTRH